MKIQPCLTNILLLKQIELHVHLKQHDACEGRNNIFVSNSKKKFLKN